MKEKIEKLQETYKGKACATTVMLGMGITD